MIRGQLTVQNGRIYSVLSSAGVVQVLVSRDWHCILRTRQHTLLNLILVNLTMTLMMLSFRLNGHDSGRDMLLIACVLFSIAALPAYKYLEIAKARLGTQIVRPEWPVTYFERAVAMIALTTMLAAPSGVFIVLLGSHMGLLNQLVFLAFMFVTAVFTTTLFANALLRRSSSVGIYLNMILFHGVFVSVLAPRQYLVVATISTVACLRLLSSGLRKFATHAQRGGST